VDAEGLIGAGDGPATVLNEVEDGIGVEFFAPIDDGGIDEVPVEREDAPAGVIATDIGAADEGVRKKRDGAAAVGRAGGVNDGGMLAADLVRGAEALGAGGSVKTLRTIWPCGFGPSTNQSALPAMLSVISFSVTEVISSSQTLPQR
jgi:hypothetical protein